MSIELDLRNLRKDAVLQTITQCLDTNEVRLTLSHSQFTGLPQADDAGNVMGAGAAVALLVTTVHKRRQTGTTAHIENTDTLRRTEFVAGERQQIDIVFLDIDVQFADRITSYNVCYTKLLRISPTMPNIGGGTGQRRDHHQPTGVANRPVHRLVQDKHDQWHSDNATANPKKRRKRPSHYANQHHS